MANKRSLKKAVNEMVFDVVEECFIQQMTDPSKKEKAEALIEEAADFQDDILSRINQAKDKADFKGIVKDVQEKAEDFVKKLNALVA